MMRSIRKSLAGVNAVGIASTIAAGIILLAMLMLVWLAIAGIGRPPDVMPVPDPAAVETLHKIESLNQRVESLKQEMQELKSDLQGIKGELERILGAGEFEATAYTNVAVPGVPDINGNGDGLTATGIPVREGLCAVDPKVIPLGSKVWVEGFGVLMAADVGCAIKNNRIDIFMSDRQKARKFKQRVRVIWYEAT